MIRKLLGAAGAAIAVALVFFSVSFAGDRISVDVGDSPTLGPANAPVTLIEFIDFQ